MGRRHSMRAKADAPQTAVTTCYSVHGAEKSHCKGAATSRATAVTGFRVETALARSPPRATLRDDPSHRHQIAVAHLSILAVTSFSYPNLAHLPSCALLPSDSGPKYYAADSRSHRTVAPFALAHTASHPLTRVGWNIRSAPLSLSGEASLSAAHNGERFGKELLEREKAH